MAKAWRKRADLRDPARLEAWLYRMARNALVDYLRARRPCAPVDPDAVAAPGTDTADEIARCVARAARCYLGTLPAIYQQAVRLAEEEGMAHAEVARLLGISPTAAKSRIRRGRQLVREKLEACCRFEFDRFGRVIDCTLRRPCGRADPESAG